ncbi:magnesium transporter [Campylobacter sp. FMV-PI01]|uniref:Magnesium transporter MgtE n=1 Tax=Campylobacter portucalensis TaxID=2608384 RepID=A0A6L5WJ63_9BACT|nr:magnesium transporter [Campylobacter portucalensis]
MNEILNDEIKRAKELLNNHINDKNNDELSGVDVADCLRVLKKNNEEEYFSYLSRLDVQSLVYSATDMPEHILKDLLTIIPNDKLVNVTKELESDEQLELLEHIQEIDEDKAKIIFDELDDNDKKDILKLSNYDDDEAGAYMQIELFKANLNDSIHQSIQNLKLLKESDEIEHIFKLFAVDEKGVLKYAIPLSDLVINDFSLKIKDVVKKNKEDKFKAIFAHDNDPIEDVVAKFHEFDLSVLPIVDSKGVLVGRITTDDIHEFIQESATEQIYNLVGVDDDAEYEDESIIKASKSRAFWLLINLFTAFLSSAIIGIFDQTIQTYVALAILMPIVASMGGNTGTQALTVTVRRLALGEIEFGDAKKVIKREIGISLVNGLFFALIVGIVSFIWFKTPLLGIVIAMAMLINLGFSGLFGTFIPLTLKKFNIDPAVGSSVLLTTATDIIGFFSFLGLATWILL